MFGTIDFSKLTLQDALDLAVLVEEEAYERYVEFAEQLGTRYPGDAHDFFVMMAEAEAKHGRQLAERRKMLFGNAPVRVRREQIFDVEAPDYGEVRSFMSPKKAFEVALQGEIKAYEFFGKALEKVADPEVRTLFLELQQDEIDHQEMLRKQLPKYDGEVAPDVEPEEVDEPSGL